MHDQAKRRSARCFLTLAHFARCDADIRAAIADLRRSFCLLRKRQHWKARVAGGIAVLEVAACQRTRSSKVHFHVIMELRTQEQDLDEWWIAATCKAWERLTSARRGDALAKPITDLRGLASYVTKPQGRLPFDGACC